MADSPRVSLSTSRRASDDPIQASSPAEKIPDGDSDVEGLRTVVPAEDQPSPLHEFRGWVKEGLRRDLRLLARLVRFSDHWEYADEDGKLTRLSASRFQEITCLAVMDALFADESDAEKLGYLGLRPRAIREEGDAFLESVRSHPAYASVADDLAVKIRAMRDGIGVSDMAEFFGSVAAYETAQTLLFAKKERDRTDAAAQFMDRVDPKKSRSEGGGVTFVFPPNMQEVLEGTMVILEKRLQLSGSTRPADAHDPVVSAKRVNVPALPPAPETPSE